MALIRDRVAGPEEWAKEDPLVRADSAKALPPLYIDCSTGDDFGFFEGAELMARKLKEQRQDVTFVRESGKHCQLDAKSASSFLAGLAQRPAKLPETK